MLTTERLLELYAANQSRTEVEDAIDYGRAVEAEVLAAHNAGATTEAQPSQAALGEIIAARRSMLKRVDDVHIADRKTGCKTFYDNELERYTAILFRAIDIEIESIDREGGGA